jgi:5-carboxymethyl-2-hydroxymuconate isomerase
VSHLTLEYSANLRANGAFTALCAKLARYMTELKVDGVPVFPPGGVRVRAIPCEEFCIADGSVSDAGFVHAILKIGAGRSQATQKTTCEGLFEIMKSHFAYLYASRGLALSLEMSEFSDSGTLKHNNLHSRFKTP